MTRFVEVFIVFSYGHEERLIHTVDIGMMLECFNIKKTLLNADSSIVRLRSWISAYKNMTYNDPVYEVDEVNPSFIKAITLREVQLYLIYFLA